MARVIFPPNLQAEFLRSVFSKTGLKAEELARISAVHPRTIRDWRRGKYRVSLSAVERLSEISGIAIPQDIEVVDDYAHAKRAASIGGRKSYLLYGNPGTPEGRSKGGKNSWRVQQERAAQGYASRFVARKPVKIPEESERLAEAFGILLGDGGITDHQVMVSVSALVDVEYAAYVQSLFKELFEVEVARHPIRKNTLVLVMTSRTLVEFLVERGLVIGDKVAQQVDIPDWIKENPALLKSCIRGLFDTDGCIYYHNHYCNGCEYRNIGFNFSSSSRPLLQSFYRYLIDHGYAAKLVKRSVYLYRESEVARYLREVGTSNPKHQRKFDQFIEAKYNGACGGVQEHGLIGALGKRV